MLFCLIQVYLTTHFCGIQCIIWWIGALGHHVSQDHQIITLQIRCIGKQCLIFISFSLKLGKYPHHHKSKSKWPILPKKYLKAGHRWDSFPTTNVRWKISIVLGYWIIVKIYLEVLGTVTWCLLIMSMLLRALKHLDRFYYWRKKIACLRNGDLQSLYS